MNIVILGPPGSGKGTQSKEIASLYDFVRVVDCGKLLRSASLSQDLKKKMSEGRLLDDDTVVSIVRAEISKLCANGNGFILDGFPRSVCQCDALFKIAESLEFDISFAVKLELSDTLIVERLSERFVCARCGGLFSREKCVCSSCGFNQKVRRSDDSSFESIKARIDSYKAAEVEIVKLLRAHEVKVVSFDAAGSVDSITNDIKNQLLIFT